MYHGVTQSDDVEHPVDEPAAAEPEPDDRAGAEKKGRVLHTRVPEVLERELKRFADNLRIPVSNLVRTILEDAVNAADAATGNVERRLKDAASQLGHERERIKRRMTPDPLASVFAFQPVKLARASLCAKCDRKLAAGASAHLGLSDEADPRSRVFVCDDCLPTSD